MDQQSTVDRPQGHTRYSMSEAGRSREGQGESWHCRVPKDRTWPALEEHSMRRTIARLIVAALTLGVLSTAGLAHAAPASVQREGEPCYDHERGMT